VPTVVHFLQKELHDAMAEQEARHETERFGIIPNEQNMFVWDVLIPASLFSDAPQLRDDLIKAWEVYKPGDHAKGVAGVWMQITFPQDFPTNPPFVRVVYPRFKRQTGHITTGGSICTELLTNSKSGHGWDPKTKVEPLLVIIRQQLVEGKAEVYLNGKLSGTDYGEAEARKAFQRVAQQHGWM